MLYFLIFSFFAYVLFKTGTAIFKSYQLNSEKLGSVFRKIIKLKKDEIHTLNQIKEWKPAPFRFCDEEAVKLFLRTINELAAHNELENKLNDFTDIFSYCQCVVLEKHCVPTLNRVQFEILKGKLFSQVKEIINNQSGQVLPLGREKEIHLYRLSATAWKPTFKRLTDDYRPEKKQWFYDEILRIASLLAFVTAKREVFYLAHKFMANRDKVLSAKLYICYKSVDYPKTFPHKLITVNNSKLLFKNKEQQDEFYKIANRSLSESNLPKVLDAVDELYAIKRRKIVLNDAAIDEAKKEHAEVVELLNEYLTDEDLLAKEQTNTQAIENAVSFEDNDPQQLLQLFLGSNYQLNIKEVNIFAQSKNIFASQLIDKINEQYYETLDDLLIEEDGENYVLNKDYYYRLQA